MDSRHLEREIEEYRARWRRGDQRAMNDFEEELGQALRRFVRRALRARPSLRADRATEKDSLAVAAAVHLLACALLSWGGAQAFARETTLNDELATRAFLASSAKKRLF